MSKFSRRTFAASAAFSIVPRRVLGGAGYLAPSDKINLACIGMGRQGQAVMMDLLPRPELQVVAVCDCNRQGMDYAEYGSNALLLAARKLLGPGYENWGDDLNSPGEVWLTPQFKTSLGMGGREPARRLVDAFYASRSESKSYTGTKAYEDFRELLDKQSCDAVYVATPDHWHAPIAVAAMRKGKHVLGQKPMAHSIGEARRMAAVAREMKVATSVTVNNPYSESTQLISQWIAAGAIGRVRVVHNWSSRPYWPQGVDRPKEAMPVPDGLNWDMWLGPAPERPYNKAYLPFVWRGWLDFGCGSFGDMGCYSFAGIFRILDLAPPDTFEATASEPHSETYPKASMVHLNFAAKGLRLSWYDGNLQPPRPEGMTEDDARFFGLGREGIIYQGDRGLILGGFNGDQPRLIPASKDYVAPQPGAPPRDLATEQWIGAIRGGPEPLSSFPNQAAPTEAFLLGCLAQRMPGEKFIWNSGEMKVANSGGAQKWVDPPYRGGWAG